MYIFQTVCKLQEYLQKQSSKSKTIGYVPTMGALHEGHLQLIANSLGDCDLSVCSIFVNPTQFDDSKDLSVYPRPIEADIEKLTAIGCDVLFLPSAEEIYPKDLKSPTFDLNGLDKTMEGANRKGHFAGVVQVVHRLLDIVKPNRLYMGQKDFQQFAIIKQMLQQMESLIQLVRVPIVREADGLAMSSRNVRLSAIGRQTASNISKALFEAQKNAKIMPLKEVRLRAMAFLESKQLEIDYFKIIDGDTLQEIESLELAQTVAACTTVRLDGLRLLDNIILK